MILRYDILNDTPTLYAKLEEMHLKNIVNREKNFKNIKKNITEFNTHQTKSIHFMQEVIGELLELNETTSWKDDGYLNEVEALIKMIKEMETFKIDLCNQLAAQLDFVKANEINAVKDSREDFLKRLNNYTNSLSKSLSKKQNDSSIKTLDKEAEDNRLKYNESKNKYIKTTEEYETKSRAEFYEKMISIACLYKSYFNQGNELCKDMDKNIKMVSQLLNTSELPEKKKDNFIKENIEENEAQSHNNAENYSSDFEGDYLYLRNNDNIIFESWNRFYFRIVDNQLEYLINKKWVVLDILKLCSVKPKPNADRRFVFEINSNKNSYLLQGSSEEQRTKWIERLNASIEDALNYSNLSTSKKTDVVKKLCTIKGNSVCADCHRASPTWASINLGCLLCIECSGIHRKLGVHVSKVRSLTLDYWNEALIQMMHELGNANLNSILEAKLQDPSNENESLERQKIRAILEYSTEEEKRNWISTKYVEKTFCEFDESLNIDELDHEFWSSINHGDLKKSLKYLIQGCDVDYKNTNEKSATTALHNLVAQENSAGIEFLFQWNANFNIKNTNEQTPLHLAALKNNPELAWLLLKRGSDPTIRDRDGNMPIDIAEKSENVKLIMAFRYLTFVGQNISTKNADECEQDFYEAMKNIKESEI